jgi:translocation and assembly module TamB
MAMAHHDRHAVAMTIRRLLFSLLLAVFLIVAGSWYWLLHTQHGASWVWSVAVSATDEALRAESLSGDLSSGVTIQRLTYNSDGVDVSVAAVAAAIDISLFSKSVTVSPANVGDVTVTLKQGDDSSAPVQVNEVLEGLQLPVELVFPELAISNITVTNASESDPFVVDRVALSGRWQNELHLDDIQFQSPLADGHGNALVTLAAPQELALDINLAVHPGLAGQSVPIAVDANLNSDFESLHVDATAEIAGTDTRATLASEIDLQNETLSGQLKWDRFRWPLDDAATQFESRTGAVTLAGTLDAWRVDGTLHVLVPEVPEGTFNVSAEGDRDSVAAEIIDGDVLGGSVAGNAQYSWHAEKRFAANLVASGIRTDTLVPDWPMTLSGFIAAEGTQEPLEFSVDVADVRGNVLGKPLAADGRFDYRESDWLFDNLRILHGETIALVNGNPYTTEGASFDVTVDQIGHYVTDAQGTLNAAGSLSLTGQLPRLQIEGTALDLAYGSIGASKVTITDQSASGGNLNLEFAASEVAVGEVSADNALLQLYVDADQQTADISITNADLQAALSMEGALDNWTEPSAWSGNLNSLELLAYEYSVALESPVGLHVSQALATLDEFQIVGDHDVRLTGSTAWTAAEGARVSASLNTMPLNLINTFFETGLTFDQALTGELRLQIDPDGAPTGRGDIAITPGSVVSNDDPEVAFSTDEARVGFNLDGGGLRTGIIDIPLPGQGQIAAEFDVTEVSVDGSADIDAIIDVDLAEIGVLAPLLPLIDDATGSLFIDLVVGGSVENPSMQGDFSLQRGALVYLPIGLVLEDIEISSEVRDDGEVELKGTFRAGDGIGRISTRSGREQRAANGLELTLAGDNLVLIDVPDVRAVANADVQVAFDGRTLNIDGDLAIPSARIRPSNIGASKVYESKDVIIVAGELPEEPVAEEGAAAIEIFGNLRTSLGDDVIVDLDVAEAALTGDVDLTWTGEVIPMADGRLTIDGEILAFGQRLDITEGQIRFPRGPVDDPYLRLRAEREIYGNTQVRRAGLLVAGSLKQPTIEAYTNPMTTEERALTLLVTGSDFDLERGVGSVDFGTYIAPKVFVSYGIGLFDTENVIRVRYDLKKGFGITGTSGQRDSGFDLSYRFEN